MDRLHANTPADARRARGPRPAITRVRAEVDSSSTLLSLELTTDETTRVGAARGPLTSDARLAALAVLDALATVIPSETVDVEIADVLAFPRRKVALVVLRFTGLRAEHVLTGSAVVRRNEADAVARATLAALNRLLDSVEDDLDGR